MLIIHAYTPNVHTYDTDTCIVERDMRYSKWKMAIARSFDWTSDRNEQDEGKIESVQF